MIRCPECRTRRATWLSLQAHIAKAGHKLCKCGGYHYAHRLFSRYCQQNPMYELHDAQRAGAGVHELLEIEMDCVWQKAGRPLRSWV